MQSKELSKLDYFTLKVLISLYENHNCCVVADALNTTQPKVSRALMIMREVVQDELFIRKQYGMLPNTLAKNLYPKAKEIVKSYESLFAEFHGNTSTPKELNIVAKEHLAALFIDAINTVSERLGESVAINIHSWAENLPQLISQGKIDLGLGIGIDDEIPGAIKLNDIKYQFIVARKNHPIFNNKINFSDIFKNRLVLINYALLGARKHWLEDVANRIGAEVEIGLTTSSLNFALEHVAHSDDICWVGSVFAPEVVEHRNDVSLIDVTDLCSSLEELQTYSYMLCHHSAFSDEFISELSQEICAKLSKVQADYQKLKNESVGITDEALS